MNLSCGLIALLGICSLASAKQTVVVPLENGKSIHFLSIDEGRKAIVEDRHDPFFRSLSRLDAELRLAEPLPNTSAERREMLLKKSFEDAVQEWTDQEIAVMTAACRLVAAKAEAISPLFVPKQWKFVKTDGSEEAAAAYTRHDAIILPQQKITSALGGNDPNQQHALARLIAHETSHVFSRLHPKVRDRLYERLGFRRVGPIELGDYLDARRITNPDGVLNEHIIRIQTPDRGPFDAVMLIYGKTDRYSPEQGRRLFDYLRLGLFPVEQVGGRYRVQVPASGVSVSHDPKQVQGFFEQIGRNTNYIIHPDEILADNLAILLTQELGGSPAAAPDQALLRDLAERLGKDEG